jgi:hypothetical protein
LKLNTGQNAPESGKKMEGFEDVQSVGEKEIEGMYLPLPDA